MKAAQKAAELPLGVMEDPRLVTPTKLKREANRDYINLGQMFVNRAEILTRGDLLPNALKDLETALALSRQLRNFAVNPLFQAGVEVESSALAGLYDWLQKVGPDRERILAAQKVLQHHATLVPDPTNSIKADYLVLRSEFQPTFDGRTLAQILANVSCAVPWEKERRRRVLNAIALGAIQSATAADVRGQARQIMAGRLASGLPPLSGPGSDLTADGWNEILRVPGSEAWWWTLNSPRAMAVTSLKRLRAADLVIAAALYQADNGKPPNEQSALVPAYLPKLPTDPLTGKMYWYQVTFGRGQVNSGFMPSRPLTLCKGRRCFGVTRNPNLDTQSRFGSNHRRNSHNNRLALACGLLPPFFTRTSRLVGLHFPPQRLR